MQASLADSLSLAALQVLTSGAQRRVLVLVAEFSEQLGFQLTQGRVTLDLHTEVATLAARITGQDNEWNGRISRTIAYNALFLIKHPDQD